MTQCLMPMCMVCKHYTPYEPAKRTGEKCQGFGYTCEAFPDGVPEELMWKYYDHRKPYPGDHGIQFEPQPNMAVPPWYNDETFMKAPKTGFPEF